MKKYNNTKHSSKKIDSNRANENKNKGTVYLTIGLYVGMRSSRYEARGKFEEHERCVRVAQGVAESNSSFLSALQTSQVLHISMNAQMTYEPIVL